MLNYFKHTTKDGLIVEYNKIEKEIIVKIYKNEDLVFIKNFGYFIIPNEAIELSLWLYRQCVKATS